MERDLLERLRRMAKLLGIGSYDIPALLNEAADEIERLREYEPSPHPCGPDFPK